MLTPGSHLSEKPTPVSIFSEASPRPLHRPQPHTNTAIPPLRTVPKNTQKSSANLHYQRLEIRLTRKCHVGSNPTSSAKTKGTGKNEATEKVSSEHFEKVVGITNSLRLFLT